MADEQVSPYIVHRLDKETSGVIMLAKSPLILPVLGRMLENKEIRRTYQAVASGKLNEPQFVISKPIGRDRHDKRKRRISEHGRGSYYTRFCIENLSLSKVRFLVNLKLDEPIKFVFT